MSDDLRDVLERAAWTAVQSAIATFAVTQDVTAIAVAGIAAGLSVIKTYGKKRLAALGESE